MHAISRLKKYIKPYLLFAIIAPILMILEVAMDLLQPTIMKHIIDDGIANNDSPYVVTMFGLMILCAILGLVGGVGCSIYTTKASVNFATDIRKDLYQTITYFSNRNKDHFTLGKLITNITSDVEMIQRALMMLLKIFVRGPLTFIGAIIIIFFTARELFPVLLFVVPILAFSIFFFTKISGKLFLKVQEAIDQVNTKVQENLAGIRVIKAYNRKNHQVDQFTAVNGSLMKRNIRADQIIGILGPLTMFVVNIGIILALWLGAIKVENGTIQVGVIIAFINYLMMVMGGLMSSSAVLMQIARALPSAKRIVDVLEETPDIKSNENAMKATLKGEVEFDQVSFTYIEENEPVLKNISFKARSGETIGIIGATGSGKSTIVKLIPRLFDVTEGEIKIDGIPIKQLDLQTLRESIAFAPQRATLFSKSIEDNVKYGKEDATFEEIIEALQSSQAYEFVEKLDAKEKHIVSQGATNLSGGQKQRLAMARAFVRKPSILILDDTTSAVDSISEKNIQKAIKENFEDTTKFIVSSKVSSIRHADQIIVLDDGYIVGLGTHEELLRGNKTYQEIVETQIVKGGVLSE
ncbi:multidrug ABC transporter ATP-binding protein [Ureibacillus massiliensis 4400831 = CIP 108448 = CCUG 49529]|uniref:Multidrug ABC transporter ATP-binding protein n=1 Tax=Ureibacillus massiliensis 4400831 = CIP 108448 = CCUG 49529 TaxID=1211035 RepID=A0A0A3J8C4_9BACL|nr:ABC transporter ATP-binding protein [Ureibacillus massiliensis]KGR92020.1 multidrug ABC transporter ATP-binding protein [Ureibacillus massiliensis 4400831 = CIP 108448 = CCUG 49529]